MRENGVAQASKAPCRFRPQMRHAKDMDGSERGVDFTLLQRDKPVCAFRKCFVVCVGSNARSRLSNDPVPSKLVLLVLHDEHDIARRAYISSGAFCFEVLRRFFRVSDRKTLPSQISEISMGTRGKTYESHKGRFCYPPASQGDFTSSHEISLSRSSHRGPIAELRNLVDLLYYLLPIRTEHAHCEVLLPAPGTPHWTWCVAQAFPFTVFTSSLCFFFITY